MELTQKLKTTWVKSVQIGKLVKFSNKPKYQIFAFYNRVTLVSTNNRFS